MNNLNSTLLNDVQEGAHFRFGGLTFIATDSSMNTTLAICSRSIGRFAFDEGQRTDDKNNLCGASILAKAESVINARYPMVWDAAQQHTIDLTALNGDTRYDSIAAKIGLPTLDHYRIWRDVYPDIQEGFWLATATFCGCWERYGDYTSLVVSRAKKIASVSVDRLSVALPIIAFPRDLKVELVDPEEVSTSNPAAVSLDRFSDAALMTELQRRIRAEK